MLNHLCHLFPRLLLAMSLMLTSHWAVSLEKDLGPYQLKVLTDELDSPWSMAFLPRKGILITERTGGLKLWHDGELSKPITGLPEDILVAGQGGLMDVVLHPDYSENQWIYLTYAAGEMKHNALTVIRGRLDGLNWVDEQSIFKVTPGKGTPVHYGGRMVFLPDQTLLITSGDGFDYREDAQRPDNLLGKIIRLNDDGSVPTSNPFASGEGAMKPRGAVFSLGHRNPQAIVYDKENRRIYAHEHGPAGGDEINLIQAGRNYGWPVITQGQDYSGPVSVRFVSIREWSHLSLIGLLLLHLQAWRYIRVVFSQ